MLVNRIPWLAALALASLLLVGFLVAPTSSTLAQIGGANNPAAPSTSTPTASGQVTLCGIVTGFLAPSVSTGAGYVTITDVTGTNQTIILQPGMTLGLSTLPIGNRVVVNGTLDSNNILTSGTVLPGTCPPTPTPTLTSTATPTLVPFIAAPASSLAPPTAVPAVNVAAPDLPLSSPTGDDANAGPAPSPLSSDQTADLAAAGLAGSPPANAPTGGASVATSLPSPTPTSPTPTIVVTPTATLPVPPANPLPFGPGAFTVDPQQVGGCCFTVTVTNGSAQSGAAKIRVVSSDYFTGDYFDFWVPQTGSIPPGGSAQFKFTSGTAGGHYTVYVLDVNPAGCTPATCPNFL